MPALGEIRYGKEIGLKSHAQFIWHACIICRRERWVLFLRGEANRRKCRRCRHCGQYGHYKNFNGKYKTNDGHISVFLDDSSAFAPMRNSSRFVLEHRLVMAKHLGHCLLPSEDVHHINGLPNDNRIENLMLMTKAEHGKLHRDIQLICK